MMTSAAAADDDGEEEEQVNSSLYTGKKVQPLSIINVLEIVDEEKEEEEEKNGIVEDDDAAPSDICSAPVADDCCDKDENCWPPRKFMCFQSSSINSVADLAYN